MKYITLLGITTSVLLTYALADEGQSITKAGTHASIKGSNEYFTGTSLKIKHLRPILGLTLLLNQEHALFGISIP